jgi:NifB/MoaA-like Fe-S oxidoreductase
MRDNTTATLLLDAFHDAKAAALSIACAIIEVPHDHNNTQDIDQAIRYLQSATRLLDRITPPNK